MQQKLFVYGTLHPGRAPDEIAHVVRRFKPLGPGTIRARLHRFHDFPAIKIDPKNGSRIAGDVFQLPSTIALKELDDYEEYYPGELDRSLFQRKQVKVRLQDGTSTDCWVYEYNRNLPEDRPAKRMAGRSTAKQKTGLHNLDLATAAA
ncbi:MAG: gamma-glutamylcyclotransferase [Acidobacteriota bacterium]|nr:gamma-glutamylcyclotransferase [Acidobacteriota bacterium]